MKIYKCHISHLKIALLFWLKMAISFIRISGVLIVSSGERHNLYSEHFFFFFQTHPSRQEIFFSNLKLISLAVLLLQRSN